MDRDEMLRALGAFADEGVEYVRVASPRALYLLKRDTVRAIDRQDATALARAFNLDETP